MTLHPVPVSITPDDESAPAQNPGALVHVRLFAAAAAELGADELDVFGHDLAEIVLALEDGASESARRVLNRSSLLVNGVACTDGGRAMRSGDRVDVLPPFAGG